MARVVGARGKRVALRIFQGLFVLGFALAALAALAYKNVIPGGPWLIDTAEAMRIRWRRSVYEREASSVPAGMVVFIGSSSVESFPYALYFPGTPWLNRGLATETARDLAARLDRTMPDARPAGVVIWTGMNDLRSDDQPADVVAERVVAVMDLVQKKHPGVPIALVSIPPQCDTKPEYQETLHDLNRRLKDAARARGAAFVDTDRFPLATAEGQLSPAMAARDRKHLNLAGCGVLARWLREEGGPATAALGSP